MYDHETLRFWEVFLLEEGNCASHRSSGERKKLKEWGKAVMFYFLPQLRDIISYLDMDMRTISG